MTRKVSVSIIAGAALIFAGAAMAQAAGGPKNVSVQIKGPLGVPTQGACASGYAAQCFSGQCGKVVPSGPLKVSGTFGKGTVTSLCITLDAGNNVNGPDFADGHDTCVPLYGDMTIEISVTKKKVTTVTDTALNLAGVFCRHQDNSKLGLIEAGWGIDGADSTDAMETGWGTITGTSNKDNGKTTLSLKGSITP
jgi:hypothetical protein